MRYFHLISSKGRSGVGAGFFTLDAEMLLTTVRKLAISRRHQVMSSLADAQCTFEDGDSKLSKA